MSIVYQDVAQYTYPEDQVWALMDEVKDLKKNLTKNHKAAEMIKEYGHDYVGVMYSVGDNAYHSSHLDVTSLRVISRSLRILTPPPALRSLIPPQRQSFWSRTTLSIYS